MGRVAHMVSGHGLPQLRRQQPGSPAWRPAGRGIRGWPLWALPGRRRAFILVVIGGYLAWLAVLAPGYVATAHDVALACALLACGVATVVLARHDSDRDDAIKNVYAVWELPVLIHLPVIYALAVPALRMALTQWGDRGGAPHRLAFGAAATGLAYGCAATVFAAMIPAGVTARHYLMGHTTLWLLAIVSCAVAGWAVYQLLMAPLRKGYRKLVTRHSLHNDATELCAVTLVALAIQVTPLALVIAFPMGTLLRRSSRHSELVNEARADAKTGLLNASAWERAAEAEVARAVRTSTPLAVALLDLDRFKQINDTYGHLMGDQVLRQIAATMTDNLREYDLAGRFGGEEFVMLLPHTRAVDALRIAERVRAQIAQLPVPAGDDVEHIPVTVSIGVAALDAGVHRELPDLLGAADAALYRAKASGRDQVQMISTSRGLSAVRPPAVPGPEPEAEPEPAPVHPLASPAHPVGRVRGTGRAAGAFTPKRQLGQHRPLAAGCRARATVSQLPDSEGVADGVAGRANTATSSAVAV